MFADFVRTMQPIPAILGKTFTRTTHT